MRIWVHFDEDPPAVRLLVFAWLTSVGVRALGALFLLFWDYQGLVSF